MAELRIGTSSWKYRSWTGLVYSAPEGIDFLNEYATKYDTVEVDQWFWSLFKSSTPRLPDAADVTSYRAAVPETFRFSVKAPNSITLTHHYRKSKMQELEPNPHFLSLELVERFLQTLEPMRDTLGPVMFQFEYLNRQKMKSKKAFLDALEPFLEGLPEGYRFGLELRNPKWLDGRFIELIGRHAVVPVLLQGYYMPSIVELYIALRDELAKHDLVIIRLHGPNRQGIEKHTGKVWDHIVAPKDDELSAIAGVTKDLLGRGVSVYVNVNNHYEGSAPLTIERFQERLL
jgi:uncharacterized protein YecE (DUF72 family)